MDVGEALLEVEEGRFQPTVADGRQSDGDDETDRVSVQETAEAGTLMRDRIVAEHESEDVEDVQAVGDSAEVDEGFRYLPAVARLRRETRLRGRGGDESGDCTCACMFAGYARLRSLPTTD